MKSGAKFDFCIKRIKRFEADHEVCGKWCLSCKAFLGKALVSKYCKNRVQEKKLIAKKKFECQHDF